MGLLSVVFAATERDARSPRLVEEGPSAPVPTFDLRGLGTVEAGTLLALCTGVDLGDLDAIQALSPEVIADGGDEGPWVFPFPAQLADRLAAMDAQSRRDIARRWGQTEELNIEPSEEAEFVAAVEEFCGFVASQRGRPLWVWMCL